MENFITSIITFFVGLILLFVFCAISGIIVMLLWNWLMPTIFGLGTISWLQGWGLSLLGSCLFGSAVKVNKD